jgi:hypothetical protein
VKAPRQPASRQRSEGVGVVSARHPGFDVVADAWGYYKVGHIYKDGPADRDVFRLSEGNYIIALDDRELKTSDNYWQRFTVAAGSKFHFLLDDKPAKKGRGKSRSPRSRVRPT